MSGSARELVHVSGLAEFKQTLRDMVAQLEESQVEETLAEVGEFLQHEARENLPSHWLLTESIGFDVDAPNSGVVVGPRHGFETNIGDPAEYGIYHEFGIFGYKEASKPDGGVYCQGPTAARHYLERAIKESEAEVVRVIASKINSIIESKNV